MPVHFGLIQGEHPVDLLPAKRLGLMGVEMGVLSLCLQYCGGGDAFAVTRTCRVMNAMVAQDMTLFRMRAEVLACTPIPYRTLCGKHSTVYLNPMTTTLQDMKHAVASDLCLPTTALKLLARSTTTVLGPAMPLRQALRQHSPLNVSWDRASQLPGDDGIF